MFPFCTNLRLSNDTVHTAHLARNEMFKVTWVQMSQCAWVRVGEKKRKKKSHIVEGTSVLPQALFHQYQVKPSHVSPFSQDYFHHKR